jgi:molecular chaperone Hsp33
MNHILRATTENQEVRAFIADTRELVNEAVQRHQTTPVASAALGRLLTAGAMMGVTLKGENDLITITVKGDGPIDAITVTVDGEGHIKGYVNNPFVDIPNKPNGKLDVSGAVGEGMLTVIRDFGLKDPYIGQCELISGEIAEDLTYYFASSEQTPSVVALGVLVDKDYSIKQSGGFILQLMPGASEETIATIERNIHAIESVTAMFESGMKSEDILNKVLDGLNPRVLEITHPEFFCNCSKDRVEKALISIGKKDIASMITDGETIEMKCHFCNEKYDFSVPELQIILERLLLDQQKK